MRQHLNMGASLQEFQNLMKLQVADAKAHVLMPIVQQRIEICEQLAGEYDRIVSALKDFFKVKEPIPVKVETRSELN